MPSAVSPWRQPSIFPHWCDSAIFGVPCGVPASFSACKKTSVGDDCTEALVTCHWKGHGRIRQQQLRFYCAKLNSVCRNSVRQGVFFFSTHLLAKLTCTCAAAAGRRFSSQMHHQHAALIAADCQAQGAVTRADCRALLLARHDLSLQRYICGTRTFVWFSCLRLGTRAFVSQCTYSPC